MTEPPIKLSKASIPIVPQFARGTWQAKLIAVLYALGIVVAWYLITHPSPMPFEVWMRTADIAYGDFALTRWFVIATGLAITVVLA